jgi:ATP-dependent Clp protease adapter protein ClpS
MELRTAPAPWNSGSKIYLILRMQELAKQQEEAKKWRDLLKNHVEPTAKERAEQMAKLQYEEGKGLFAVAYSTIHKAACDGNVDGLRWFLTGKGRKSTTTGKTINVDEYDAAALSPIHYAAERGHNAAIEFLLAQRCGVDVKSGNGNTALMYAAKTNKCHTIELLHANGAQVTMQNMGGMTPVHFAVQGDHIEALTLLKKLYDADLASAHRIMEAAVEDGEGVVGGGDKSDASTMETSITDDDSSVTTHHTLEQAVYMVGLPMCIEVNTKSKNGTTPLHMCANFDSRNCLEFLLRLVGRGIDINETDCNGETAAHKAARKSYFAAYEMLLAAGANDELHNLMHESPQELLNDHTQY